MIKITRCSSCCALAAWSRADHRTRYCNVIVPRTDAAWHTRLCGGLLLPLQDQEAASAAWLIGGREAVRDMP